MKTILDIITELFVKNALVMSFLVVGIISMFSNFVSAKITRGKIHSSAIAIFLGLVLAYVGGRVTGGSKGLSDISIFAGLGILGGSSLRDFAIISTSYGAKFSEIKKCGLIGVLSPLLGIIISFLTGAIVALAFGYTDAVSVSTIAAGTVTFIVGPVTGAAIGADSIVVAISIACGLFKSIAIMLLTPFFAKKVGVTTPRSAMIFGGLMGSASGTTVGLAAIDVSLVPYAAMTATFYTGLGCLLCPSVLYPLVRLFLL